jgi:hypothetical protein
MAFRIVEVRGTKQGYLALIEVKKWNTRQLVARSM